MALQEQVEVFLFCFFKGHSRNMHAKPIWLPSFSYLCNLRTSYQHSGNRRRLLPARSDNDFSHKDCQNKLIIAAE